MAIDKIFNDSNVDGIADNIFNAVNNSVSEVKQMQQRKAAENAQLVIQSLKKIDTDIREKFDNVTDVLEKRVSTIKDGRNGINGKDGRDGKDGRNGKDGLNGKQGLQGPKGQDGVDGVDGVSVNDAHIDFDGSLIIGLSDGKLLNVGEVVSQDLQERIKIVTSGGAGGGGGDVVGPTSATDNAISRFDGTTGKLVQNSVVTIGDTGNVSGVGTLSVSGNTIISTTDNTNAALRVTQLGTGNALLVEDSVNPDATPFVIDGTGQVIQGYTVAINNWNGAPDSIASHSVASNARPSVGLYNWSSNTARVGGYNFYKSVSNTIGTQGIVASGQQLGRIAFNGDDGVTFIRAAEIDVLVDGTPGLNDMPGALRFNTTADGASTPTERVRIDSTGQTKFSYNAVVEVSDNTNAALRITQLGTGNALLVEDSTNPDATPFLIDNAGQVLSGYTATVSPTAQGRIEASTVGSTTPIYVARQGSNSAKGAELMLLHARAGVGTNTSVAINDATGEVTFWGADGTNFVESASVKAFVDGTPGTSDMPGRLVFSTTADGASTPTERVRITSAGKTGFATSAPASTVHVAGDTILSNVNVISASYDSVSFSVAGEETTPTDLFFSPDGLKMYVIGSTGDEVNEYNLSTAWIVSSAVFVTNFSVASQETSPQGLFFRADGTKMYIVGATNDTVFQYTLSTPWSVATASYDSISFSVATQETSPTGLSFRPNGLSMYVVGNIGDAVHQYTLSTAWNVSTATFLQSFSTSGQESQPSGVTFTGDGSRMFVVGSSGDDVNVYNLTTPWDISTSAFVNVFSVSGQDTSPQGIYIKPDGTKMYIMGQTNDTVFQYTVSSIDIQLTGQTSVAALDVQQDLTVYGNIRGKLSSCTVDGTNEVGFKNIPQNSQSAAYTLVLADAGKHILHPAGDANARTYTIPANSSVAYPIGTAITFINMTSQVVTIAITTDTMYLSSAGTTGSRSLAQYGSATAIKITSTNWLISGSGLT